MSAVDRAAEVLRLEDPIDHPATWSQFAHALDRAGLLVTDEIQAVLDAAVRWSDGITSRDELERINSALDGAVDAYLASRSS